MGNRDGPNPKPATNPCMFISTEKKHVKSQKQLISFTIPVHGGCLQVNGSVHKITIHRSKGFISGKKIQVYSTVF